MANSSATGHGSTESADGRLHRPRAAANEDRSRRPRTLVAGRAAVLPGSRAVLGALLCILAALLTLTAYSKANKPPTTRYVVASADLEPGATIEAGDLQLVTMRLPSPVRSRVISRMDDLLDATVLGPVAKGELIQIGNVIKKAGGPKSREFSFPVEAAFADAGRVRSSDRVDVLATFGSGESAETRVIAAGALVAHVDHPSGGLGAARETLVVTLAITSDMDPLALAGAVANAKIMLLRTTGTTSSDSVGPEAPRSGASGSGGSRSAADEAAR